MSSNTEYYEVNPAVWRRGQPWTYNDKKYIIHRSGAGYFLSFGIVDDAFTTGFTMKQRASKTVSQALSNEQNDSDIQPPKMDNSEETNDANSPDGEPSETNNNRSSKQKDKEHPRNDEIIQSDDYNDNIYAVKQAIGHARTYEWSVLIVMFTEGKDEDGKPKKGLFWGDSSNTKLYWEDDGITLHRVEYTPFKRDRSTPKKEGPFVFTDKAEKDKDGDLSGVRVIANRSIRLGQFIADIDPYLDALFTLACIFEMIGLWSIRTIGVPILKADESLWDDENSGLKTEADDAMRNYGVNSRFVLPSKINGVETEFEIYAPTSNPNFEGAIKGIIAEISMGTGIPAEVLLGNPVGLRSSGENKLNYYRVLQKIQELMIEHFEWMYRQMYKLEDTDDFYLEINPFKVLDEMRQLEIKTSQVALLNQMKNIKDEFGLSPQAILDWIGIDIPVDEQIIAQFQKQREAFMNQPMQPMNNESKPSTNGSKPKPNSIESTFNPSKSD